MSEELKLCPFCGQEVKPNTVPKYDPMSGCDRLARRIYCANPECSNIFRDYTISEWNTRPIEDKLQAELARRDEIIARLKEDAERLAKRFVIVDGDYGVCECIQCNGSDYLQENNVLVHMPDCPITLHRALMKELE